MPSFTPLYIAAQRGFDRVVTLLLTKDGSMINQAMSNGGGTAIFTASERGHAKVVELLLTERGINTNLALYVAAQNGHVQVVDLLLRDGRVDVNESLNDGTSPLAVASSRGHMKVVQSL